MIMLLFISNRRITCSISGSQIIRAMNGHKQIEHLMRSSCSRLPFRSGLVATLKSIAKDPKGALCLICCYAVLPYYEPKVNRR